jgi:hypothetical protein
MNADCPLQNRPRRRMRIDQVGDKLVMHRRRPFWMRARLARWLTHWG